MLVLFSGGVDSTLLAALAHRALPDQAPIDLATICFDSGRSPDRPAPATPVPPSACIHVHTALRLSASQGEL